MRFRLILLVFIVNYFNATAGTSKLAIEPERSSVYLHSGEFKKLHEQSPDFLIENRNRAYRIALDLQRIAINENKDELTFLADLFLARCHFFFNDATKSIRILESLYKIALKKGWFDAQMRIDIYFGATFLNKRNYVLADKHYKRALLLATKHNKKAYLFEIYEKLGYAQILMTKSNSEEVSKKYFFKGLDLALAEHDTMQLGIFYTRIAMLKNNQSFDSSTAILHKAIGLLKKIKDTENLVIAYKILGDAYYVVAANDSALYYYLKIYKINKHKGRSRSAATEACDVAYMYGLMGKLDLLDKYADTAVFYSRKDRSGEARLYVYHWLADIYMNVRKFEKSSFYYKAHAHILDSTIKSGNSEALVSAGMESDFNGQLDAIQLKREREREAREREKKNQAFLSRLYLIAFFVSLIFLIVIFREFRINAKQKKVISKQHEDVSLQKVVLEIKNKEITDSINYALRIQSALLPNHDDLIKLLHGSFLYYAPKDIVSGDFYWFYKQNDVIYIACGDCTGHGVPGALMSVLGINLLADIIDGNKATEPSKILDLLRAGIIRSLNKDNESGLYKDGMDLALIKINTKTMSCVFAGANNPIYHISRGNLTEYKASPQPVGYSHKQEPFTQTEFSISPNDHIILFTDGFADQFGGASNKKFMYKKFKEILVSTIDNNEKNIEKVLETHFIDWKGKVEQVDDVCVLGIKV
jgi:serine phosphatase RsbU (regulator of sigma subunit)